ncbi:MAG TPA: glycoside hydrolase family 125 protein [Rhodanobacteraceae bacterium]|nr:glycoside hydrolase family 125 protein [Rhodanobacteraceae bacterium]
MNDRRDFLKLLGTAAAYGTFGVSASGVTATPTSTRFPSKRPPPAQRKFTSPAVERELARVKSQIGDPKLAWLFENCYPNTLDTTVHIGTLGGQPDTFIVTGDIDAMWLRDSSAQVWPYLPLAAHDEALRRLYRGLIHRQARCIAIDPYANAFMADPHVRTNLSWAQHDDTDMKPGVAERKWEIDSLCWTIRLAHGYWKATGDRAPFDEHWRAAMQLVLDTFRTQQRKQGPGPYHFQRTAASPTDALALGGYGWPGKPVGMIFSMFRPSDDACKYPLFVPGNAFAVVSLRQLAAMVRKLFADESFARDCGALADEVEKALAHYALMHDAQGRMFWAYEVDGYGNQLFMDDANVPSLLSLPYLGYCKREDRRYQSTRALAWSGRNPYFFSGKAAQGIGGPHEGLRMIWPMSMMIRALTSDDASEIRECLHWLGTTDAGTGFMHEAFDQDDPSHFTRAWFAWANSLFGELVIDLATRHLALLKGHTGL